MNSNEKEYATRAGIQHLFGGARGRGINKNNAIGGLYLRDIQTT